jgi:flagellar biosynthesis GTPase FlhF
MDETSRYGSLLSLAARTRLEVSFLTQGQRIPDDLEAATKEGLVKLLAIPAGLQPAADVDAIRLAQKAPLGRGAAA